MTASTAEAPLLGQRIPVGAFGRGAGVSPGRRSRQRTAPPETAQESRTHGEIGAHFLRNRPEVAGTRPRAKPRQPMSMPACSSAQYAHAAKPMLAPNAPQTIARKRSWRTPVEPRTRPYKSNPHPPPPTCQKVTHNYQRSPWRAAISRFSIVKCRQQISHGNTAPCVAKPPPAIREVTP